MNAVSRAHRWALLGFFAVLIAVASGFSASASWAQRTKPRVSGPILNLQPPQALVPTRRRPMLGDTRYLPADVSVRSTLGVKGFDQPRSGRVQVGGAGGANVIEQIVNTTLNPADDIHPFFTRDEQFIYFASNRTGSFQLYRLNALASNNPAQPAATVPAALTNDPASSFDFPALSPNNDRIVFSRSINNAPPQLYVARVPASGLIDLTPAGGLISLTANRPQGPRFERVGRAAFLSVTTVVFSGRLQGQTAFHLFTVDILTGQLFQLTDGPASEENPAVSPGVIGFDTGNIAFDSNATGYAGRGVPNNTAVSGGVTGGSRNIFIISLNNGNVSAPVQFTNAPGTHVQPSWSFSRTNPQLNPRGTDVYIAFASTRRDVRPAGDPSSPITSFTAGNTFDVYYARGLNPGGGPNTFGFPFPETPPGPPANPNDVNPTTKLDTADPLYIFNDEYPTWAAFINIRRIAHQSDREGTYLKDRVGAGFTPTPTRHDLFISTVIDITAPTLLRYDTARQDGEIVHINQGTTFNPNLGASVRTPRDGITPGSTLFFTVRVEDRESGMQPEKNNPAFPGESGRGAVFLLFKNPNSQFQQSASGEHKEWISRFETVSPVTTGTAVTSFTINAASNPQVFFGSEYEAQGISASDYSYYFHNLSQGTVPDTAVPEERFALYTASVDDAAAFSGVAHPPLDGGTYVQPDGATVTTPNVYLKLNRLAQQDNQGGILYGASWQVPAEGSDWYIDVIAYDNAVNPYEPNQFSNFIIYDNVWGFSTATFNGAEDILFVSDYTLGQKFFRSRFDDRSTFGTDNVSSSIFYGAESYFTDQSLARSPTLFEPAAANGPFRPFLHAQAPRFFSFQVDLLVGAAAVGRRNVGLANTLGVNSYTDEFNDDGFRVAGVPAPVSQRYEIWRLLSRGPLSQDVYSSYLPQPERETPPDLRVNETAPRRVRVINRMIVWSSPFSGNFFTGPGTITDQATQIALTNYVNAGGKLFISGQDIGFALTLNGQAANAFFTNVLKAQFAGDRAGAPAVSSTSIANRDNSIAVEPWSRGRHAYGQHDGMRFVYNPPNGNIGISNFVVPPAYRTDAALTAAFLGGGNLDAVTPISGADVNGQPDPFGAYSQFNYTSSGAGLITSRFPSGGQVAYASFGFETMSYEWYSVSVGPTAFIATLHRRAEVMHNITCSMRTGTISGRILNASQGGAPLADVLVRAVPSIGAENQPAIATAATDANGNYQLVGLKPDNYVVYGYRRGYTIQHSTDILVHGDSRSQADVSLTEAPPGALAGRVTRADGTPLSGIEVQAYAPNPGANTFTVLRAVTGSDGTYSITGIPVGGYTVVANPNPDVNGDGQITDVDRNDPRFNANHNAGFVSVAVTSTTQTDITAPGLQIQNGLVQIVAGQTQQIDFRLAAVPQNVAGRVVEAGTGTPIAGATVIATQAGARVGSAVTAPDGTYTLPAVPDGSTVITASALGFSSNSVTVAVGGLGTLNVPDIALTRLPPGAVSGLVTLSTPNGPPVAGATVRLFAVRNGVADTAAAQTTTTGVVAEVNGYRYNYRFASVPPGPYVLTVERAGLVSDPASIPVTVAPGPASGGSVAVGAAEETKNVNFRLLPLRTYGEGIQLISTPLDYSNRDPRDIFALTAGEAAYNAFNVADWTGADYNIAPTIPLLLGKGYFVRFGAIANVQAVGTPLTTNTFNINLPAGWSLIGNPFFDPANPNTVQDIDLAANVSVTSPAKADGTPYSFNEAVGAGLIRRTVFSFTGSNQGAQYVQGATLRPWLGYWIRAFQPVTLTLRNPGNAAGLNTTRAVTLAEKEQTRFRSIQSKGAGDWRLQIAAKQGDLLDTDNSIGVAPNAKDGFDFTFDSEKPPMVTQTPSLYVALEGTNETGRAAPFADDIRASNGASGSTRTWNFTVETGGTGEVTLFWPNINRLPRGLQPTLVDASSGRRIPMRTSASSYRFTPSGRAQRKFRIEVAPAKSLPLTISNITQTGGGGRARGGYRFAFTTSQEADVQAEIQTLTGRTVRALRTRSRAAQESAVHWDGRAADGSELPAGPYMLSLTARDDENNLVRSRLMLLNVK